jgi:hypothetical protein
LRGAAVRAAGDEVRLAIITGTAVNHARWRPLTPDEEAAAVAELARVAAGRADLLAQAAGLALGFHAGTLEEPRLRQAAGLLVRAGADEALIPAWEAEGRRRAGAAARLPYPGDPPG